jgi:hypothetical protein
MYLSYCSKYEPEPDSDESDESDEEQDEPVIDSDEDDEERPRKRRRLDEGIRNKVNLAALMLKPGINPIYSLLVNQNE